MRKVYIIGVGMHKMGRFPEESFREIGREAVIRALEDCGITWPKIQAAFCGTVFGGMAAGHRVLQWVGLTGIPIVNVENACASGVAALRLAWHAIGGGIYDIACAVGAEKRARGFIPLTGQPMWKRRAGMVMGPAFYAQEKALTIARC